MASILSGLLPNMMVGADQAMAPIQQVLDRGLNHPEPSPKKEVRIEAEGKGDHKGDDHKDKKCKPKSKEECEEEERCRKQHQMEEMIRKLILIFLLFLLLFIVIMALFALGHHARWQASLLPEKVNDLSAGGSENSGTKA